MDTIIELPDNCKLSKYTPVFEITGIASQFAMHFQPTAIHFPFCVAVKCDTLLGLGRQQCNLSYNILHSNKFYLARGKVGESVFES